MNNNHEHEYVYFQLNNWMPGDDYPDVEPFSTWLAADNIKLMDEDWVKENKLCVSVNLVDMSLTFRIAATKEWVNTNCPELLTKYKEFIVVPDGNGIMKDKFCYTFNKYNKDNIGVIKE